MRWFCCLAGFVALVTPRSPAQADPVRSEAYQGKIFSQGNLKPTDSDLKVRVGDAAPDFKLPSVAGGWVSLSQYRGERNVVLSFVPAAWTAVCSDQWPGYNIVRDFFDENAAVLLGITVDNIPTLHAWTREMGGLWFPVLSDFWPHGEVAGKYGVLRSDGITERAIVIIDKMGIIRYLDVHDINRRPRLEVLVEELRKLNPYHRGVTPAPEPRAIPLP